MDIGGDPEALASLASVYDSGDQNVRRAVLEAYVISDNTEGIYHIAVNESSKAYLTREVDDENKYGVFGAYKGLVQRVSDIILEINPDYQYPHMLVSTIIEGAHHQRFFADHLPRLTDVSDDHDAIVTFYSEMVAKAIA